MKLCCKTTLRRVARIHCVTLSTPPRNSVVGCKGLNKLIVLSVVLAEGERPVPSRTRKLSPPAPMVLHSTGCGRVGHRRHQTFEEGAHHGGPPFCFCGWVNVCWT